jgi:hypothetical protein
MTTPSKNLFAKTEGAWHPGFDGSHYNSPYGKFAKPTPNNSREPMTRPFDADHDYIIIKDGFETADDFILSREFHYGIIMGDVIYWFEIGTGNHIFTQKTVHAKWDVMSRDHVRLLLKLNSAKFDLITAMDKRDQHNWSRSLREKKMVEEAARWAEEIKRIAADIESSEALFETTLKKVTRKSRKTKPVSKPKKIIKKRRASKKKSRKK